MEGPLEGIRVVDCSWWLQGPLAAGILGDLGADVVKIEQPKTGDPLRGLLTSFYRYTRNMQFEAANRNKRGMVLDLTKEEGKEVLGKQVKRADVFLHNFRPRAARKLGVDYATLSSFNPRLVYAAASAWGPEGPDSGKPGFDVAAMARTGLMYTFAGNQVTNPQEPPPIGFADVAGATYLTIGILAALQAREHLGRGQVVDTSIFGSTVSMATFAVSYALAHGSDIVMDRSAGLQNPLYYHYKCADGEWIHLLMLQYDRYWPSFCEAAGTPQLLNDPRFTNLEVVIEHTAEVLPIIARIMAGKSREEWIRALEEWDMPYSCIQRTPELARDPQALANGYVIDFDHPAYGREKMVGIPYRFSETAASIRRPCPEFGQHTEEVLLELGYTWDEIARLKELEVI